MREKRNRRGIGRSADGTQFHGFHPGRAYEAGRPGPPQTEVVRGSTPLRLRRKASRNRDLVPGNEGICTSVEGSRAVLRSFFLRHLGPLLPRFGKANGNGLLAVLDLVLAGGACDASPFLPPGRPSGCTSSLQACSNVISLLPCNYLPFSIGRCIQCAGWQNLPPADSRWIRSLKLSSVERERHSLWVVHHRHLIAGRQSCRRDQYFCTELLAFRQIILHVLYGNEKLDEIR